MIRMLVIAAFLLLLGTVGALTASGTLAQVVAVERILVTVFRATEGQSGAAERAKQLILALETAQPARAKELLKESGISGPRLGAMTSILERSFDADVPVADFTTRLQAFVETDRSHDLDEFRKALRESSENTARVTSEIMSGVSEDNSPEAVKKRNLYRYMVDFCLERGARMSVATVNIIKFTTSLVVRHPRLDADDLIQDAIIRLKSKCHQVLNINGDKVAYFRVLVSNLVRDYYRAYYRGLSVIEANSDAIEEAADSIPAAVQEELNIADASSEALGRLADVLTERQQAVLTLWLEALTANEIAQRLSISVDRVKEIKASIRAKAENCLGRSFDEAICAL